MVKLIVLLLFVLSLAVLPVWAFDRIVAPELAGLKQVYGGAEATARQAIGQ